MSRSYYVLKCQNQSRVDWLLPFSTADCIILHTKDCVDGVLLVMLYNLWVIITKDCVNWIWYLIFSNKQTEMFIYPWRDRRSIIDLLLENYTIMATRLPHHTFYSSSSARVINVACTLTGIVLYSSKQQVGSAGTNVNRSTNSK